MMMFTPVVASNARMFRPSRPMIRPFMSSLGSVNTLTLDSAVCSEATRWIAIVTIFRARSSPSSRARCSISRTCAIAPRLASSTTWAASWSRASVDVIPAIRSSWALCCSVAFSSCSRTNVSLSSRSFSSAVRASIRWPRSRRSASVSVIRRSRRATSSLRCFRSSSVSRRIRADSSLDSLSAPARVLAASSSASRRVFLAWASAERALDAPIELRTTNPATAPARMPRRPTMTASIVPPDVSGEELRSPGNRCDGRLEPPIPSFGPCRIGRGYAGRLSNGVTDAFRSFTDRSGDRFLSFPRMLRPRAEGHKVGYSSDSSTARAFRAAPRATSGPYHAASAATRGVRTPSGAEGREPWCSGVAPGPWPAPPRPRGPPPRWPRRGSARSRPLGARSRRLASPPCATRTGAPRTVGRTPRRPPAPPVRGGGARPNLRPARTRAWRSRRSSSRRLRGRTARRPSARS